MIPRPENGSGSMTEQNYVFPSKQALMNHVSACFLILGSVIGAPVITLPEVPYCNLAQRVL